MKSSYFEKACEIIVDTCSELWRSGNPIIFYLFSAIFAACATLFVFSIAESGMGSVLTVFMGIANLPVIILSLPWPIVILYSGVPEHLFLSIGLGFVFNGTVLSIWHYKCRKVVNKRNHADRI